MNDQHPALRQPRPVAAFVAVILAAELAACGGGASMEPNVAADIRFVDAGFYPASLVTSGGQAGAISPADFNRDGAPDMVVSNCGGGGPSILLGNGDGSLGAPSVTRSDIDACAVGTGDFNNDGAPDIVAGSYATGNVTILLGDGTGEFAGGERYRSGLVPMQFSIDDFNGDGQIDIASMNYTPGTVQMLFGRGDGRFDAGAAVAAANMGISIFAADLDSDGDRDLVVTEGVSSHPDDLRLGDVNLLFNRGDGSFSPRVGHTVGFAPEYVEAGDLDGDGLLDLVVGNALSFELSILYGTGGGAFEAEQRIPLPDGAPGIKLADFNLDGKLDIATIQALTSHVLILMGDGRRGFTDAGRYRTAGLLPESFAATDLDNDGCLDLVIPGNSPELSRLSLLQTHVSVLRNASGPCNAHSIN